MALVDAPAGAGSAAYRRPCLPNQPRKGRLGQLSLGLTGDDRSSVRREVLPGVVHVAHWLDLDEQRALVREFRRWAEPPAGLRHPRVPAGHVMTVQSVCLGWHWYPYVYSRTADDTDGAPVKPMPDDVVALAQRAVADDLWHGRGRVLRARRGDRQPLCPWALISACTRTGRSRPRRPSSRSASATRACSAWQASTVARHRSPTSCSRAATCSCSAGPNRLIFHGVPKVLDGTAPAGLGLPPGRLSITVRETGLA